jgi:predicted ABC-type ATPase
VSSPLLVLVAGPNGAGKTTLVDRVLRPTTHLPFVNADVIAAERWPDDPLGHAYEAARIAADERTRHLDAGESFIAETVFSHESKVALARDAAARGYLTHLHVVLIPEDLAVARVAERVLRGGHDVPERKVRERYARLWPLVAEARRTVDRTVVWDNSTIDRAYRRVASYTRGRLVGRADWPAWTPDALR